MSKCPIHPHMNTIYKSLPNAIRTGYKSLQTSTAYLSTARICKNSKLSIRIITQLTLRCQQICRRKLHHNINTGGEKKPSTMTKQQSPVQENQYFNVGETKKQGCDRFCFAQQIHCKKHAHNL